MKIKKRYLKIFLAFIVIFLLIFICVHFLSKGYTNKYTIDEYHIKEVYTKDEQDEHNNYYIEITANNIIYNYQFYMDFDDDNKLVKDIVYYDGEYKCLLPILSDNVKVDFLCYKDSNYYNYQDIKGKDDKLDRFIKKIDDEKYDDNIFKDKEKESSVVEKITYYKKNIPNDFYITMSTLKGIVTFNEKVDFIELFDKEVYKRELSVFSNNYYVSADYSNKQEFSKIYIVNILDGKEKILTTPDYISFDSYIQGVVDNCVYIYDINNEKQYKVNIDESLVTEVGNANKGIRYYDGNWSYISAIKANNGLEFKDTGFTSKNNNYTYKFGNKLSGFYYYFYEVENGYEVFRANVQRPKSKKYLFTVNDYTDVIFEEDYVFYKKDNSIKLYSDYTGIRTIILDNELEFNNNIKFNVYKK